MNSMSRVACIAAVAVGTAAATHPSFAFPVAGPDWDTVSSLKLEWTWTDLAGGHGIYVSDNWSATLDASFDGLNWNLTGAYRHLTGPHGETTEPSPHMAFFSFRPGITTGPPSTGIDDHEGPIPHPDAHHWLLVGDGPTDPAFGGFAIQQVTHVPEPAPWLMLAAALSSLGLWRRRA